MSHGCPYSSRRQCEIKFPQHEVTPSSGTIRDELRPVVGLLADLAFEYDNSGPSTTATEFVQWLQLNVAAA